VIGALATFGAVLRLADVLLFVAMIGSFARVPSTPAAREVRSGRCLSPQAMSSRQTEAADAAIVSQGANASVTAG
jgi:hypothetical protein